MKEQEINAYIERVKIESTIHKFLKEDVIKKFIEVFNRKEK